MKLTRPDVVRRQITRERRQRRIAYLRRRRPDGRALTRLEVYDRFATAWDSLVGDASANIPARYKIGAKQ